MQLKSLISSLPKPCVIIVLGRRGSGKDTLAYEAARAIHAKTGKSIYVDMKPEDYDLPSYFKEFRRGQMPNNGIFLLSDAHLSLYAREWGTDYNKTIDKFITISRHRNADFLFTTQESSRLDRNVVSAVDAVIFKEPSLLAGEFERPEIRKLAQEASEVFKDKPQKEKWQLAYAVTHTGNYEITGLHLPYYWSEELSKRYGKLDYKTDNAKVIRISGISTGKAEPKPV